MTHKYDGVACYELPAGVASAQMLAGRYYGTDMEKAETTRLKVILNSDWLLLLDE